MSFWHNKKLVDIYLQMQKDKETAFDKDVRDNFVAICHFVDKQLEYPKCIQDLMKYGKIDFVANNIEGFALKPLPNIKERYNMIDALNSANIKLFPVLSVLDITKYNFYKQGIHFYLWLEPWIDQSNINENKCYLTISFDNEAKKDKVNWWQKALYKIKNK